MPQRPQEVTVIDESFDRAPPHDIEAEMCALGAAMLSPDAAATVVDSLRPDDFYRPAHQAVFAAVCALSDRGEAVNAVTVRVELEHLRSGREHVPDGLFVHSLIERVPLVGGVGFYVKTLRDLAALRRLTQAGPSITAIGYTHADADHAVESAQKVLDEATRTANQTTARSVADLITPFLESLESGGDQRGVTTGFTDLGRLIPKLRPGQLVTIGARPGQGKTATMSCMAHHVGVKLGLPVYVATLEMSADEFMARMVAHDAQVNLGRLLEPSLLTEDDWTRLGRAHDRMSNAPTLIIDDEPGMNLGHIRTRLRSMRRSGKPAALAVIDYLQLMQSAGKVENRQVEVSQFSRSMKVMAKEYELPVVVGSQLNRDVEKRADKRPTCADLRESGSVEQDSDIVILLYRPDSYDPESPRAGEIDLIVDKNRSGPRGTVTCAFQGHYSRVVDMAGGGAQ